MVKKILFYNWTQFDKANNNGGGVNVYQKNLIEAFTKKDNYEVYFLSSGINYDLIKTKPYIKKSSNKYGDKCKSFKLWNSSCPAPTEAIQSNIDLYLNDSTTVEVFIDFIKKYGPFDIIHFNNIEGLPVKCLDIKEYFPNTKLIYSLHNYSLFCPNGILFYDNEKNCKYCKMNKCNYCCRNCVNTNYYKLLYKVDCICEKIKWYSLPQKLIKLGNTIKKGNKSVSKDIKDIKKQDFALYKKMNVEIINKNIDYVLAVSDRVREIAVENGIIADKIKTNYIGTEVALKAKYKPNKINKNSINIIYMGYFNKQKGFDFLINALEQLPKEYAKKINFSCYARVKNETEQQYVDRIKKLNSVFKSSKHYNGYSHSELKKILSKQNLGIVPVIWEDNLPQVAIEFNSYGVAVLTSNLGGANELSKSKYFKFEESNTTDFIDKLKYIIDNPNVIDDYFKKSMKLTTMEKHIAELEKYYK